MSQSHLVIASFGVTAYECAAVGAPSLIYSLSEDHMISAKSLVNAGLTITMGRLRILINLSFRKLLNIFS